MLWAYHKLSPKPKSITKLKEALQVVCMGQPSTETEKIHAATEEMRKSWRWTFRTLNY